MGLIGTAVGAAGSIFGGISASKAMKKVKQNIQNQMKDNQNWYDRRYNEDSTQRADAQRVITMTEESIKKRNKQAAGTQAVMGGTDESVAAAKEANSRALADTMSQIAINGEARKDNIESQYMATKADLNNQLNQTSQAQAQAISQAVQGVTSAAGSMPF